MFNYRLVIEYEGTRYFGWQEQKNARTIAGELRVAAEDFFASAVEMAGAGRTDAGVHALAQVARLKSSKRVNPVELQRALNDRLPPDINVLRAEEARASFDPRRDAIARYYLYQISSRRTAFAKRFVWWVKDRLDAVSMEQACAHLRGRKDYSRFCDKRVEEKSTMVAVHRAELAVEGDLLLFRIGASHFLWKMVRRIVGALVEVGRGNLAVEGFKELLGAPAVKARGAVFDVAARTAPPSGLFLESVLYEKGDSPDALLPAIPIRRF
jgi:tRNA pseudouridine38-40 synthase